MKKFKLTEGNIRKLVRESVKSLLESYYGPEQTPESIMAEYNQLSSHEFDMSDYAYEGQRMSTVGFVYDPQRNTLYAGFISNAGCNRQWEIEYDTDFSFDENLQSLYDAITNDPNVEPTMEESIKRLSKKVLGETLKRLKVKKINESVGSYGELSDMLNQLGWDTIGSEEVTQRSTGNKGLFVRVEKSQKAMPFEQMIDRIKQATGKEIIPRCGQNRNAPEMKSCGFVIMY